MDDNRKKLMFKVRGWLIITHDGDSFVTFNKSFTYDYLHLLAMIFAIQMSLDIDYDSRDIFEKVIWGHPKKIILIGEISVGKTSVMRRFVHRTFEGAMKATIGADFMVKEIELGQEWIHFAFWLVSQSEQNKNPIKSSIVTLQIWDTAGGERFQSLGMDFYMDQFDWLNRLDQSEQFIWMKNKNHFKAERFIGEQIVAF